LSVCVFENLLLISLVPQSAWFSNLRSELSVSEWDQLRKKTYKVANYVCEICGERGHKHPVECHERWKFDIESQIQTLVKTIALCPACHEATHYGLARIRNRDAFARAQLMRVNNWSDDQVERHITKAFRVWEMRNSITWNLDARWILGEIIVCDKTKQKIITLAKGFSCRKIKDWQQQICEP
jgi:hypothetical protein